MSKKLFFEVLGIICFVESCLRQAPLEIREWAKRVPSTSNAKKGKFLTGQARILEMVKVIRARCTKVFVPVENNNVLARSQRKF